MSEVCTHSWVERAGKAQAGDCVACLKAELDRLGKEWEAEWIRRDDIADRRLTEKLAALKRAEAAEATRERAIGLLHRCVLRLKDTRLERDVLALFDAPAEPLRTPMTPRQQAAWDKLEAMAARAESAPEPLRTEAQCMTAHHPSQAKECASCQARALRTEGAPKRCGHIICASIGAEPCLVEGAPKQEEPHKECDHGVDVCWVSRAHAAAEEVTALRVLVAKLVKQMGVPLHPDWACRKCVSGSDILIPGFLCPFHEAAALAPEAPVEKDGGA